MPRLQYVARNQNISFERPSKNLVCISVFSTNVSCFCSSSAPFVRLVLRKNKIPGGLNVPIPHSNQEGRNNTMRITSISKTSRSPLLSVCTGVAGPCFDHGFKEEAMNSLEVLMETDTFAENQSATVTLFLNFSCVDSSSVLFMAQKFVRLSTTSAAFPGWEFWLNIKSALFLLLKASFVSHFSSKNRRTISLRKRLS